MTSGFSYGSDLNVAEKELSIFINEFLNENHLQGFTKCDVFVGLFYNDELVQCMGFNKKGWHDGNVELTRMVSKMNIQVIGGFSKLMSFIKEVYGFTRIISYVYKAWFNGKGYFYRKI